MKNLPARFWHLAGMQRALLLYVVLPLLITAGLGIGYGLDKISTLESDRLKEDVELIGRAIRLPIGEALAVGDEEAVRRTLQAVFDIGRIYGASVFDVNGNQVAAAGITERDLSSSRVAQQVVTTGEQQERYRQVSGMFLFSHFIPVFDDLGRTNGFIQINRRASDFDASLEELSRAAWIVWWFMCFATIAIVIFGHYGGVGRHVSALTMSMNRIENGERAHRADETGPTEIASVARGLNRMLDSIHRKDTELAQHQAHEEILAQQLQRQEKMAAIGRVAGGIAHELGAPLTVIDGRARRLLKHNSDDDQVRQLNAIRGQVGRLTRIVRQLLNYTRQNESGLAPVRIPDLVEEAVNSLRHELPEQAPVMAIHADRCLESELLADESRLELALVNVLRNAAQAATHKVEVSTRLDDQQNVIVEVRDDGPGLPGGVTEEQLLQPFFTTKVQGEGTGLGLAIVDNVMAEHGGKLTIRNHPEGGCVVTLRFPPQSETARL